MTLLRSFRWLPAFLFGVSAGIFVRGLHAQEQPAPETRTWQLRELPYVSTGGLTSYRLTRVDAIDTESVCLYVARSAGSADGTSPAVTAVPKTQLPKGAGCQ